MNDDGLDGFGAAAALADPDGEGDEAPPAPAPTSAAPRCPSCAGDLGASGLMSTTVAARPGRATVFSCPTCGTTLGVAPA